MVAQSDLPYRLLCEHLGGVGLSYTQMIHAANFVVGNGETFRSNHLDVYPLGNAEGVLDGRAGETSSLVVAESQARALEGLSGGDVEGARRRILAGLGGADGGPLVKPTVVQIAGSDASVALEAARMILDLSGTSAALRDGTPRDRLPVCAIDLNLGCPQRIARSGRYGSFLHDEEPDAAYSVLSALREHLPGEIGVTAKIRLPPTSDDHASGRLGNISETSLPQSIDERIRRLVDSGVDLITVHGRTRFENKNTVGPADWDAVRRCADVARERSGDPDFPVVSNGGIEFGRDVTRCLEETGADGVMVSEAILENPTLFVDGGETEPTSRRLLDRQLRHASSYLDYATLLPPLPGSLGSKGGSFNVVRSHLFKFLHRYLEEETDLRSRLGDNEVTTIAEAREIVSDLKERYESLDDGELGTRRSSSEESSWYRRHRTAVASAGGDDVAPLTVEERKERARARISAMREERERRVAAGAR